MDFLVQNFRPEKRDQQAAAAKKYQQHALVSQHLMKDSIKQLDQIKLNIPILPTKDGGDLTAYNTSRQSLIDTSMATS